MTSATLTSVGSSLTHGLASSVAEPASCVARKRRRGDNNCGTGTEEVFTSIPPKMSGVLTTSNPVASGRLASAQPIVTVLRTSHAKRPQLKYDPSVPMTKEETSVWRAEQRRKRNRESAAACRKRQRDRIAELESEVEEWRHKFAAALGKLRGVDKSGASEVEAGLKGEFEKLRALSDCADDVGARTASSGKREKEGRCCTPQLLQTTTSITAIPTECRSSEMASHVIPPCDSHKFQVTPSPVASASQVMSYENADDLHFPVLEESLLLPSDPTSSSVAPRIENRKHFTEIDTRSATSRLPTQPPLTSIESACDELLQIVPDSCLSLTKKQSCPSFVTRAEIGANRRATTSFMAKMTGSTRDETESGGREGNAEVPVVLTDESDEGSELDEFLLDAVRWL